MPRLAAELRTEPVPHMRWPVPGRHDLRTRRGGIEKRLARAQRERRTRARRPRHTNAELPVRARSLARNVLLFATSLVAGALLAHSASKGTPQRWNGQPMALHTISVLGHERLTSAEIAEMTGLPRQADLAEVPLRNLEERIARHPWIRTARVVVLDMVILAVSLWKELDLPSYVVLSFSDFGLLEVLKRV